MAPKTPKRESSASQMKPLKKAKANNPGGRPRKLRPDDRTLGIIRGLGEINATHAEAAAVLGVCRETLEKFLGTHKNAYEAYENGKAEGRVSLRRKQYEAALGGNTTMLVWLGKQLLGQKDKHELGGDPNWMIKHHHDFQPKTAKEAADMYVALVKNPTAR
jgi:hypothetical protein